MNIFRIPGRCVGLLIALACSALLIYNVGVRQDRLSKFEVQTSSLREKSKTSVGQDRLLKFEVPASSLCETPRRLLKTSGPNLCLSYHNIFFVETSQSEFLNPRQACAVESAARYHPSHDVLAIMSPNGLLDFTNGAMKVLNSIKNVKMVKVDLANLFEGSPYYDWYMSNVWQKSPYKVVHISDGLRLYLLWTFGGMYLDTDVVVLKSLSSLRNTVVSDNGVNAGSSVMFFDRGHPMLARFMSNFLNKYNPAGFAANGPLIIHRDIIEYCGVASVLDAGGTGCNVSVLPMDRAYPIPYERWKEYFQPASDDVVSLNQKFNSSYLIHTWNFMSSKESIVIGSNSLYELAMKEHCPRVYEYAKELKRV